MSEIKKTCDNCKHCDCSPFKEPCSKCLDKACTNQEFRTLWEPKDNDNLVRIAKLIHENGVYGMAYSDTVFKTENDLKIDHIDNRVEDIQANVLEYGNNAVSKIIGIKDQLKEQNDILHNFDTRIDEIDERLCDLDTRIDGLESMLKDIQKSLETIEEGVSNTEENVFNAIFHKNLKLNGLDIKQVDVDERPTEKELEEAHERLKKMTKDEHITLTSKKDPLARAAETSYRFANRPDPKFKDGDLVKISGERSKNKIWVVKTSEFNCVLNCWTYLLMDVSDHDILAHEPESKLVEYDHYENIKKKPEPKFKVGDFVKYKTGLVPYFVTDVKESNCKYFYDLERRFSNNKRNYKIAGILESRLEEVK